MRFSVIGRVSLSFFTSFSSFPSSITSFVGSNTVWVVSLLSGVGVVSVVSQPVRKNENSTKLRMMVDLIFMMLLKNKLGVFIAFCRGEVKLYSVYI